MTPLFTLVVGLILASISTSTPIKPTSRADSRQVRDATFDYVVIGGGTAGMVIATTLARASYSVALVEAGGVYEDDIGDLGTTPAFAIYGAGASPDDVLPAVDWGFVTTPQAGLNNRRLHYARGKTLGGSSARNYFTYQRPTVEALDRWASILDDASYRFDNFLPFYRQNVNYTPPNNAIRPSNASVPPATSAFTAGSGPLHVSFSDNWVNPVSSYFKAAWEELGLPVANDFVSGILSGVQYSANTINPDGNTRTSSNAFLSGMEDTSNLSIYARTLTKRVLFDGTLAVGAVVDRNGSEVALMASKEVIICAGTFQSPQLLMASGIGPHETLKRFNITVVSELEGVGQNLEDHLLFGASYHVTPITHSALSNATFLARAISEYAKNGTGILSNPGGEVLAWERLNPTAEGLSDYARDAIKSRTPDWPTFEFLMLDAYSGNNQNYITGAPDTPFMYASPAGAILVQQSRGNITISSIDTAVPPVINPNWLTHPADQELSLLAFKRLREMMNTDAMKGVWVEEVLPGLNVSSDEGILDAIRETAIQLFHAACTCKMGKSPESGAVVDARGRVFGTQSLRIVDASVLPFLPPGHPQATVYALAAKIAKDIIDLRG